MADTRLTHEPWLERALQLRAESAEEWSLRLGDEYPQGAAGYVVRAALDDDTRGVLKLIWLLDERG